MVVASDSLLLPAASYLESSLGSVCSLAGGAVPVCLAVDTALTSAVGYRLDIRNGGIDIAGGSYEGVISGIATLRQLLWGGRQSLPQMKIEDSPRFTWRGVMLDVARHFFTADEVKSLIDEMALYKLNKLHLHLTDDQGWRLEIKSLPELTGIGAWSSSQRISFSSSKSLISPNLAEASWILS